MKLKRPFVTFGRTKTPARHAFVDPDFDAAVEDAVGHLAALGHERIGLVLPDRPMNYLALVEAGYRRALNVRGLPVDEGLHLRRPAGERGGLEAADALIGSDRPPTAVLVTDSMHAVALYRRLGERGLRPGRDLSVLALLPEARAQYLIPTLTTVQTDWTASAKSSPMRRRRNWRSRRAKRRPPAALRPRASRRSPRWRSSPARAWRGEAQL